MARTVKDPQERRRELIASAQRFFYDKGYENTSVSDIVGDVGVAQGTFYYYFDSKPAVLEALVAELTEQGLAVMRDIVADESLDALQKWNRALAVTGAWKLQRKAEMLALLHAVYRDDNVLLRHKMEKETIRLLAPEFAQIIAQGVAEGTFETAYVLDSAEVVLAIIYSLSDYLAAILLDPGAYDDPRQLLERKIAAAVAAIERVLAAPPGSLSLVDPETLAGWVEEPVPKNGAST